MTGTYKTIDGSIYKVYYCQIGKAVRTELVAECIKSSVREGKNQPFIIKEKDIERNVRHKSWKKI